MKPRNGPMLMSYQSIYNSCMINKPAKKLGQVTEIQIKNNDRKVQKVNKKRSYEVFVCTARPHDMLEVPYTI